MNPFVSPLCGNLSSVTISTIFDIMSLHAPFKGEKRILKKFVQTLAKCTYLVKHGMLVCVQMKIKMHPELNSAIPL